MEIKIVLTIVLYSLQTCIPSGHGATLDKPCRFQFDPKVIAFVPEEKGTQLLIELSDLVEVLVPSGKEVRLQCLNEETVFRNLEVDAIELKCNEGILTANEGRAQFDGERISCTRAGTGRAFKGAVIRNGTCDNDATNIDVYVKDPEIEDEHLLYSVCHDETTSTTLYSRSSIDGKSLSEGLLEDGTKRPNFKDTGFFPFNVKQAYSRVQVYETLTHLLGSEEMVDTYIPKEVYYFARGHLFPNGDPIRRYEKAGTFYYINVVPQWQILNAGNWKQVEMSVRTLAEGLKSEVKVWTGTYGVLNLKDTRDKDVAIWLENGYEYAEADVVPAEVTKSSTHRLPVPKFMWKVVYHKGENAAVAIVQVNNPWAKISKADILCVDICDKLNWLNIDKEQRSNVNKGYTYCCDVKSLKSKIKYLPKLSYSSILNDNGQHSKESGGEDNSSDDNEDDQIHKSNESESSSSSEEY